jgi:HTH-type transcriptional regulator/antitoxin HigA
MLSPRNIRPQVVTPHVLKTAAHLREALHEAARLAKAKPARGTMAAEKLELLKKLVRDYEHRRLAKACPDPLSAIQLRMRERGLKQKDLVPALGGKNRVSEVLAGKRSLTVAMIRALSASLDIPAELLVRETLPGRAMARRKNR